MAGRISDRQVLNLHALRTGGSLKATGVAFPSLPEMQVGRYRNKNTVEINKTKSHRCGR